ncbi:YfiR family protein [Mariprofundus ferrooxydans]|nr:YfiR family protein [Mariprofundus ferrooxydans]
MQPNIAAAMGLEKQYQVEAAMLYQLFNFVTWPDVDRIRTSHDICMTKGYPGKNAFDGLNGLSIDGVPVSIRELSATSGVFACDMILISEGLNKELLHMLDQRDARHVLTISDNEKNMKTYQSLIGFYKERGKIRLSVRLEAIKKAGFRIKPQLLRLMRVERENP